MSTKYKKTSKAIALDQIERYSGVAYEESKIKLGKPKVLDLRVDITDDENTFINVDFSDGKDTIITDENGFIYRRLMLDDILNGKSFTTYKSFPLTVWDVLDDINREHDLSLVSADVINRRIDNPTVPFSFRVSRDNPAWISGDINMSINYAVPTNFRTTENGSMRLTENGLPREIN